MKEISYMNEKKNSLKIVLSMIALILMGVLIQIGASYILDIIFVQLKLFANSAGKYMAVHDELTNMQPQMIAYVCFFSPLIEEIVFRLGLISLCKKFLRFIFVNIIQAVLFGFYHGNVVQGTYAFILGLLLGVLFEYAGGFLASFIVHIIINVSGLYLTPVLPSLSAAAEVAIGLVCTILTVVFTIFVITSLGNKKEEL